MAKQTLLEMTQDILSDIDSDEVNDINDTPDSLQVAGIIKSTFFEIIDSRDAWPHLREMFQLDAVDGLSYRTHLKLPVNVKSIQTLRYNKVRAGETKARWHEVTYLTPEQFLDKVNTYNSDADNVVETSTFTGGAPFLIKNDESPTYWTSFDDEYIVFNSYLSGAEAKVQASKTQCIGYRNPTWSMDNSAIPDLPEEAFSYLLSEAKKICFSRVKQVAEGTSNEQSIKQRRAMSRKSWRAAGGLRMTTYARPTKK